MYDSLPALADIPASVGGRHVKSAAWNSINVVEAVRQTKPAAWAYRLTTSLVLSLDVERAEVGLVTLAGTMNRQASQTVPVPTGSTGASPDHLAVWGPMIESMETGLRASIDSVYVTKTKMALDAARQVQGAGPTQGSSFIASLGAAVAAHGEKRKGLGSPAAH